ncbi:MAG TPA: hypothetical protein VLM18_09885 [Croceibacterium sp.]|nr:hypothetical protein [Croceibacterium sp.]
MTLSKLIPAAVAVAALAFGVPAAANKAGEAKLAKILAGRVAGKPVRCLDINQRRNMDVVDRTALVFRDGSTLYVNRPTGVELLTWSDVPVFKVFGDQVCQNDIVHLRDRSTGMGGGSMTMGDFVPYRKAH